MQELNYWWTVPAYSREFRLWLEATTLHGAAAGRIPVEANCVALRV